MGLKEVLEETKAQLEEAEKAEKTTETDVSQKPEVVEEKPVEDEKPKEKADEKPSEEKPVTEEKPKTNADYARERREAKASKLAEELAEARARIALLEKPKAETKEKDPEPNKAENPQDWNEWKIRKHETELNEVKGRQEVIDRERQNSNLRVQAESELQIFEAEVRQQNPDYDDVKRYYANMLAASMKIVNPKLTNDKIVKMVGDRMMVRASELLNEGHDNPVSAMYEEAKRLGYQAPQRAEGTEEKVVKADLSKVAANRARNAGTAGGGGRSDRGELTPAVAAQMTNAEFAKLKPEEKRRLFGG